MHYSMTLSLPRLALAGAVLLLIISALHYPLATTFPIGGDAMSYIRDSRKLLQALAQPAELLKPATYSHYPLSQIVFSFFAILPTNWPERYIWFASVSFIVAGLALGRLSYRLAGWPAAALAIAAWSATFVTIQPHIEDGTIAQLLSLAPLFIFFERLYKKSYAAATLFLFFTFIAHPLTGIIGLLSTYAALIVSFKLEKKFLLHFLLPVAGITFLALVSLLSVHSFFDHVLADDRIGSDSIRSWLAPVWALFPVGLFLVLRQLKKNTVGVSALAAFVFLSFLFTFNNHLGIGVWTFRFSTYLISALILLFSLALPALITSALSYKTLRVSLAILLVITMFVPGWISASYVFAYNESPARYARLHKDERAAFDWMTEHLPPGSSLVSTEANRHTEWIPILTPFAWQGTAGHVGLEILESKTYSHVIYLKKREGVPDEVRARFPVVYETKAVAIFSLAP